MIENPFQDNSTSNTNSHLKFFDELIDATGLLGDEYTPIIKSVWYSLLSTKIATKSLNLGTINVDGRIHLLVFLKSGHGKGEIKRTIKQVLKKIDKSYIEPTSFHPEQFVGKIKPEKDHEGNTIYKEILGHLSLEYILIDEGKNLITSNESHFTESRRYLRMALDPYPNNEITKKSVDIDHKHALKYSPTSCVCIFLQPYRIDEEIVLDGDFRRFTVPYVMTENIDKFENYRKRIRGKSTSDESLEYFSEFLDSLNVNKDFQLNEEAVDSFDELSILLIEKGTVRSAKSRNYLDLAGYTIQNILLKFSAIQAFQNNTHIITPEHVELAFLDYAEILELTYDFIDSKIIGSMDYGEGWEGADKKAQKVLAWLYENDATSYESSKISIKEYKERIMEVYNVKERQARRKFDEHKEKGWIDSKKGQYDSWVWLAFQPDINTLSEKRKVRVDKVYNEKYQEIISKHF